jgi:hypothetical protein
MQGAAQYALVLVEGLSSSSSPGLTRWSMMKRNSAWISGSSPPMTKTELRSATSASPMPSAKAGIGVHALAHLDSLGSIQAAPARELSFRCCCWIGSNCNGVAAATRVVSVARCEIESRAAASITLAAKPDWSAPRLAVEPAADASGARTPSHRIDTMTPRIGKGSTA